MYSKKFYKLCNELGLPVAIPKNLNMKPTNRYTAKPSKGVNMDPVSLTIPDQSLTITQILHNQQRGLPFPRNNPQYTGDLILPVGLDRTEVVDEARKNLADIKTLEATYKHEEYLKAEKRKKRSDEAKKAEKNDSGDQVETSD